MTPKSQLARNLRIITCTIMAIGVSTVVLFLFVFIINSREQENLIEAQLDGGVVRGTARATPQLD